ncbi:MAG: ScyD/ScyE family protein, partial [Gemmatimonadota bacterium]
GTFPVTPGAINILRVSRSGEVRVVAAGFATVLGLDFDRRGRLYVLESTPGAGYPTPFTGRVTRISGNGSREVVVEGLFLPTGMRFGPDGMLYISNKGFGPPQPGEILRVNVPGANKLGRREEQAYRVIRTRHLVAGAGSGVPCARGWVAPFALRNVSSGSHTVSPW